MMLFFTELLVRGTLLCLLIALALLLLRRAAATYRHLLCTLALGGLLTLPLVQELLPPLPLLEAVKPVAIAVPVAPVVLPEPIPSAPEPIPQPLASGETIVLGTIQIPSEVRERWDSLPQGPYLTSGTPPPSPYEARFSLDVTVAGKGEQKLSARLPFTVLRR